MQQKFTNMKSKGTAFYLHLHTSVMYAKLNCQIQLYFSGEGNVAALEVYSALRNWKKQLKEDICFCLNTHTEQPGSRIPFSS